MRTKITGAVDAYIRLHAADMSMSEIAGACGISKTTVSRYLKRLRLSGELVAPDAPEPAERAARECDVGDDHLDRLVELRDRLYAAMESARVGDMARLSAEYRSVLDQIDGIRRSEGGGDDGDAFDRIGDAFRDALRPA